MMAHNIASRVPDFIREPNPKRVARDRQAIKFQQGRRVSVAAIFLRLTIQTDLAKLAGMKSGLPSSFPPNVPIWVESERMSGAPCFEGTSVPVSSLFTNLERGPSLEEYPNCFPGATREQEVAVLEYAHRLTLQSAAEGAGGFDEVRPHE